MTIIREADQMAGVYHQLCGKPGCKKRVGHGRHYDLGVPVHMCECGFASTTMRELERHLKEVENVNKMRGQRTLQEVLEGEFNPFERGG